MLEHRPFSFRKQHLIARQAADRFHAPRTRRRKTAVLLRRCLVAVLTVDLSIQQPWNKRLSGHVCDPHAPLGFKSRRHVDAANCEHLGHQNFSMTSNHSEEVASSDDEEPTRGSDSLPPVIPIEHTPDMSTAEVPWIDRAKTFLIGKPRDLADHSVYESLSLVAFLAWVGLGADGLSSSCYGPSEAFHHLGQHSVLAVFLSLATVATVFVISACYSHIIEDFPSGGGGYLVASKLLGKRAGLLSGCALMVDYVLTVTVSIAAAGDALFGFLDKDWTLIGFGIADWKLAAESAAILFLIVLNLRGVKESILALLPVFLLFLVTHAVMISGAVLSDIGATSRVMQDVATEVRTSIATPGFGLWGMVALLLHAYSLGAGTYTGIEAVSNSMAVMREPRVATGKRTMLYMSISLSLTAGGLMLAYLLLGIHFEESKTMNHLLTEAFVAKLGYAESPFGTGFVLATMLSEGALLIVAAQAGFIGGPRALANMARDSWVPHWFANLSERLATHNGIVLMGLSALAALLLTRGNVSTLVIMYSINVFITFALSMIGMCAFWWQKRTTHPEWKRRLGLFSFGAILCCLILAVTVIEKFGTGGWITLAVTGGCVAICEAIHRYYSKVSKKLRQLDETLGELPIMGEPNYHEPIPDAPTAVVMVGGYGGLGIHTIYHALSVWRGHYKNLIFVSVGVLDSGNFKGASEVEELRKHTERNLNRYVELGQRLGVCSAAFMSIGTDAVDELEHVCLEVRKKFPTAVFFAGQLVFQKETWYQRLLHNRTAYSIERRLHWAGCPIMILPNRVR